MYLFDLLQHQVGRFLLGQLLVIDITLMSPFNPNRRESIELANLFTVAVTLCHIFTKSALEYKVLHVGRPAFRNLIQKNSNNQSKKNEIETRENERQSTHCEEEKHSQ